MKRPSLLAAGLMALLATPALSFVATAAEPAKSDTKAPAKPAAAAPTAALAANGSDERPQKLGDFQSWDAYTYSDKGTKVCYVISKPTKTDPSVPRKEVQALVTHRLNQPSNVVNFVAGYPLKPGSPASVDVDGKSFELFTKDDGAWARDADTDKAVTIAMSRGKVIQVKGSPAKGGKDTVDTYSLTGFSRALAAIDKACNVKR